MNSLRNLPWLLLIMAWLPVGAGADIVVKDDTGAVVQLAQPARRIISLAPSTTELLFAAGAGKRIVGVVRFSNYPPAAKKIPRVGSYNSLDLERIIQLKPDLIVGWQSGTPNRQLSKLRRLGYAIYLAEPRKIQDIPTNIERLGRLTGNTAIARRAVATFERRYRNLQRRYHRRPVITVFYQIWQQPLMTVNDRHLISAVIRLCGGRNVFADLPLLAPRVSLESVLAANPEVIIAGGMGQANDQWLTIWRRWPQFEAVRKNNLFFINPDLLQRHSPRILHGAAKMCRYLEQARAKR